MNMDKVGYRRLHYANRKAGAESCAHLDLILSPAAPIWFFFSVSATSSAITAVFVIRDDHRGSSFLGWRLAGPLVLLIRSRGGADDKRGVLLRSTRLEAAGRDMSTRL